MPESRANLAPARCGCGLITLEWLLIIAAMGAIAALAVLVVERTLDDETEVPVDHSVRLTNADIDAAFVAAEAVRTALRGAATADTSDDYSETINEDFAQRCRQIVDTYSDVLEPLPDPLPDPVPPEIDPWDWDWDWDAGGTAALEDAPEGPAKCIVAPRADLTS